HPWRVAPFNSLLECYLSIDPLGYADEIQQTFDFLETILPRQPYDDLLVLLGHRWDFLAAQEKWEEARAVAQQRLAIKAANPERTSHFYGLSPASFLCWLSARQEDWDGLRHYAGLLEEWSASCSESDEYRSEAAIWQALAARQAGEEAAAR